MYFTIGDQQFEIIYRRGKYVIIDENGYTIFRGTLDECFRRSGKMKHQYEANKNIVF
jgi:hypothetical protein